MTEHLKQVKANFRVLITVATIGHLLHNSLVTTFNEFVLI